MAGQCLDVVVPARVGQFTRLAPAQWREIGRQFMFGRHLRAVDQYRNDLYVGALQRPGDLAAHQVVGIVEPAVPVSVRDRRPVPADDGEQHLAAVEQRLDMLVEIHAALYRDVPEQVARPKLLLELVVQTSGPAARVGAPVTDEDPVSAHMAPTTVVALARARPRRPIAARLHPRRSLGDSPDALAAAWGHMSARTLVRRARLGRPIRHRRAAAAPVHYADLIARTSERRWARRSGRDPGSALVLPVIPDPPCWG